ncbi:MAG: hypothetical protein ACREKM_13085, partial [Longimicrobiales bacterium]
VPVHAAQGWRTTRNSEVPVMTIWIASLPGGFIGFVLAAGDDDWKVLGTWSRLHLPIARRTRTVLKNRTLNTTTSPETAT